MVFVPSYILSQWATLNGDFGVAFYGAVNTDISAALWGLEGQQQISVINQFTIGLSSTLASPTVIGRYNRLTISATDYARTFVQTMRRFGWVR
jgi:hypothetical protein